jgi:hypothetical protein
MHQLFLLELVVFSGAALAWGFWELHSTNNAIRKREAEEATAREKSGEA